MARILDKESAETLGLLSMGAGGVTIFTGSGTVLFSVALAAKFSSVVNCLCEAPEFISLTVTGLSSCFGLSTIE